MHVARSFGGATLVPLVALSLFSSVAVPERLAAQALACDLSDYTLTPGLSATMSGDLLAVEWEGTGEERLSLRLGLVDGAPIIDELAISGGGADWVVVATDASFEFKIVEGLRRISNQQLVPLRAFGGGADAGRDRSAQVGRLLGCSARPQRGEDR